MPRVRQGQVLNPRAAAWTASLAAGAGLAAAGALLSRWCADPALAWTVTLAAAAAGAAGASRLAAPGDAEARVWTAGAALAALLLPAVLRVLGLGLASADRLQSPLGGAASTLFVLAQAAVLIAAAAAAWSQAVRGAGRRAAGVALIGAAAAAAAAARACEPATVLAAAGLVSMAAAVAGERPWAKDAPSRLRARAFAFVAVVALALGSQAPGLLRDVWTARLQTAYPGGRFLAYADDGARVWAGYEYSDKSAAALRDGVLQSWDPVTTLLALRALTGQREGTESILLVDSPDPRGPLQAQREGLTVALEWTSTAEHAVVDALGGPDWRKPLENPLRVKTSAALVYLPRPLSRADRRRAAGKRALSALKTRLTDDASVGVLVPPDASPHALAAVLKDAAAVFGHSRAAELPNGGTLVVASTAGVVTDSATVFGRLPLAARLSDPKGAEIMAAGVKWREAPSVK